MMDDEQLKTDLERSSEAADLDFKSSIDLGSAGDWLSLIKDIAAFANSGGGTIFVGLTDDGAASGADVSAVLTIDPADVTNKIHKYTGTHFHSFEILECQKGDTEVAAIRVRPSRAPVVFTRVGTFETSPGQQKTVFSVGTMYFRHGAKSEPGNSDDVRAFIDRELEIVKRSWLDGITRVVEAPAGSRVAIVPPEAQVVAPSGAMPIRITDDKSAPAYYAVPIDTTHPYRQKEVVHEVNARLAGKRTITSHDILGIRRVYEVQKNLTFCYTQNFASPRYSEGFVDWIEKQYASDPEFFEKTKKRFDELKHTPAQ